MDTPREIAKDEWWQAHLYGCETCRYSKRTKSGKYYCDNKNAVGYGMFSEDIYSCDEYVEGSMV